MRRPAGTYVDASRQELPDHPRDRLEVARGCRAGEDRGGEGESEERDELVRQVIVHGGSAVEVGEERVAMYSTG